MPYNFRPIPDSFHTDVTAEALRAKIDRTRCSAIAETALQGAL